MTDAVERYAAKIPEVTLVFWIIKIAATTLGETGGDTVTMTPPVSPSVVAAILMIQSKRDFPEFLRHMVRHMSFCFRIG